MYPSSDIDMKSTDADDFGLLLERTAAASDVGVPAQTLSHPTVKRDRTNVQGLMHPTVTWVVLP
jgi:hypothetical protein